MDQTRRTLSLATLLLASHPGARTRSLRPRVRRTSSTCRRPPEVVDEMCGWDGSRQGTWSTTWGRGDGRIPVTAATKYGAAGARHRHRPAAHRGGERERARGGVTDKVKFVLGDLFELDLSPATVITLYLLPQLNLKLRPMLWKLKPGTRIVSHDFDMGDWKPEQTVKVGSRSVHFWRVPKR